MANSLPQSEFGTAETPLGAPGEGWGYPIVQKTPLAHTGFEIPAG